MALLAGEVWVQGFVRDASLNLVVTTTTAGARWSNGWLRDADGRLVVASV